MLKKQIQEQRKYLWLSSILLLLGVSLLITPFLTRGAPTASDYTWTDPFDDSSGIATSSDTSVSGGQLKLAGSFGNTFTENFSTDTYKNTTNTDANWDTSLSTLTSGSSPSTWIAYGTASFSSSSVGTMDLERDSVGTTYIAYTASEGDSNQLSVVRKTIAGDWTNIGSEFATTSGDIISLKIGLQPERPYVLFSDADCSGPTVMFYDNSSWSALGTRCFTSGVDGHLSFDMDTNDIPYVAYRDSLNGNKLTVMRYTDSSWSLVGDEGFTTSSISWPVVAVNNSNIPYVAFRDEGQSGLLRVFYYSDSQWLETSQSSSIYNPGEQSIKFDSAGNLYVAFEDSENSGKLSVKKYDINSQTWDYLGTAGFSPYASEYPDIDFNDSDTPYVSFQKSDNTNPSLAYFSSSWISLGDSIPLNENSVNLVRLGLSSVSPHYVIGYIDGSISNALSAIVYDEDTGYLATSTAQSLAIDDITDDISAATLSVTQTLNNQTTTFYLSNDGGSSWEEATLDVEHIFLSTGSDLRWKVLLESDTLDTAEITNISISYRTALPLTGYAISNPGAPTNINRWTNVNVDASLSSATTTEYTETFSSNTYEDSDTTGNWNTVSGQLELITDTTSGIGVSKNYSDGSLDYITSGKIDVVTSSVPEDTSIDYYLSNSNLDGWEYVSTSVSVQLNSIQFIDRLNGWAVGDGGTIIKTTDGGKTWSDETFMLSDLTSLYFFNTNRVFIAGKSGAYASTIDSGTYWINGTIEGSVNYNTVVFPQNFGGINGFVAGCTDGDTNGEIFSVNGFETPSVTSLTTTSGFCPQDMYFFDGSGVNVIVIGNGSNGGVYSSVGYTFESLTLIGLSGYNILGGDFIDKNHGWVVTAGGQIFSTSDGGENWVTETLPISGKRLEDVDCVDSTHCWAVTGSNGPEYSTEVLFYNGSSWAEQPLPLVSGNVPPFFGINFYDENFGWAVGGSGYLYRTESGGVAGAWESVTPGVWHSFSNPYGTELHWKAVLNASSTTTTPNVGEINISARQETDSATLDVLDSSGNPISCGNCSSVSLSDGPNSISISDISYSSYDSLKLKVTLSRRESTSDPALNSWQVEGTRAGSHLILSTPVLTSLTLTPTVTTLPADGTSRTDLEVKAFDQYGALFTDSVRVLLEVVDRNGSISPAIINISGGTGHSGYISGNTPGNVNLKATWIGSSISATASLTLTTPILTLSCTQNILRTSGSTTSGGGILGAASSLAHALPWWFYLIAIGVLIGIFYQEDFGARRSRLAPRGPFKSISKIPPPKRKAIFVGCLSLLSAAMVLSYSHPYIIALTDNEVTVGDTIQYTCAYTNSSTSNLTNLNLNNPLSLVVDPVTGTLNINGRASSTTAIIESPKAVNFLIGNLPAGASGNVSFEGEVKSSACPAGGVIANTMVATYNSPAAGSANSTVVANIICDVPCGNGIIDADEQCDDGNRTPGDGCSEICKIETAPICGNGSREVGEECDDGDTIDGNECSNTCISAKCGDNIVQNLIGEECDAGLEGNSLCSPSCTWLIPPPATCGNGAFNPPAEACDPSAPNSLNGKTCSNFPPFNSGTLLCSVNCQFDTSKCTERLSPPEPPINPENSETPSSPETPETPSSPESPSSPSEDGSTSSTPESPAPPFGSTITPESPRGVLGTISDFTSDISLGATRAIDTISENLVALGGIIYEPIRPLVNTYQDFTAQNNSNGLSKLLLILNSLLALLVAIFTLPLATNFDSALYYIWRYIWTLFTEPAYIFARKKKQWGVVYDSLTKQPVPLAVIKLFNAATGVLIDTKVTGSDGRYYFIVDRGQDYFISVKAPNYTFPSRYTLVEMEDGPYENLYKGQRVKSPATGNSIAKSNRVAVVNGEIVLPLPFVGLDIPLDTKQSIHLNIPLDRVQGQVTLAGFQKRVQSGLLTAQQYLSSSATERQREYRRIIAQARRRAFCKYIAHIGPLVALISYIFAPSWPLFTLLLIHAILLLIFKTLAQAFIPKPWGYVFEKQHTSRKLSGSLIRLFDAQYGKLLMTQISASEGRYGFAADNNKFILTCEKENYTLPEGSIEIHGHKNKLIRQDIAMVKNPSPVKSASPVKKSPHNKS